MSIPQTTRTPALLLAAALALASVAAPAPCQAAEPLEPRGDAPNPAFNRLYDYEEMTGLLRAYARAYPEWVTVESIGKSLQGRDIWVLTVNNPASGPALS